MIETLPTASIPRRSNRETKMTYKSITEAQIQLEQNKNAILALEEDNEKISDYITEQLRMKSGLKRKAIQEEEDRVNQATSEDFFSLLSQRKHNLKKIREVLASPINKIFSFYPKSISNLKKHNIKYVWQIVSLRESDLKKLFCVRDPVHIHYRLKEYGLFQGMDIMKIFFGDFDFNQELEPQYTLEEDAPIIEREIS